MKIKAAIIGLGKVFHRRDKFNQYTHFRSLLALKKNLKLVCAVDPIKKRRLIAENYFNCETYHDLNILKNKEIDLLILCSPTSSHLSNLLKILKLLKKKPKIILFEKPVGSSIKQSLKIKQICKKNKILIFVNYFRDYEDMLKEIKKIFNSNSEGYVEFSGNYMNNSSHFISLFMKIFGQPIKIKVVKKKKIKNDHILDFNLYFKNKNVCYFKNTYHKKNHHFFRISNKKKILTFNNFEQSYNIKLNNKTNAKKIKLCQNFNKVYENVIKYFNKKKYCLSSIENAIKVHKILLVCQKKISTTL